MAKSPAKKVAAPRRPGKDQQVTRDEFVAKVMENRAKQDAPRPAPPKPTPAQQARIDAEIAAGQAALRRHAEKQKLIDAARAAAPKDPNASFNVPVYRPPEFVLENKVGGK